ncbi:hypothetical protein V1460_12780 [Streptomyces sp. SCSIO 30461]|uniref:hypothetical protein n=1 Tax=Streptomyces sp. SCSIO 30461 TaxID=3118085 RepID=UPI0030D18D32
MSCLHFDDERHRQRTLVGCECIDECCLWPEKEALELNRRQAPRVGDHRRVAQPGSAQNGRIGQVVSRFMMWAEDAEEVGAEEGVWVTLSIPGEDLRGGNRRRRKVPRPLEWFGPIGSTTQAGPVAPLCFESCRITSAEPGSNPSRAAEELSQLCFLRLRNGAAGLRARHDFDMQVEPRTGPVFRHVIGPYRWSSALLWSPT